MPLIVEFIGGRLVAALSSAIVRSAMKGARPGRDEWASVVTEILDALVAEQDETAKTLERIEAKLDYLIRQTFMGPFRSGQHALADAARDARDSAGRNEDLALARRYFTEAINNAQDPLSRSIASWHLAMVWLLRASPADCQTVLYQALTEAFRAALNGCDEYAEPPEHELEQRIGRYRRDARGLRKVFGGRQLSVLAKENFRREQAALIDDALALASGVQATRQALGTPAASCPPPRLLDPDQQFPHIAVDLDDKGIEVLGFGIRVHRVRVYPAQKSHFRRRHWLVDADLALRFPLNAVVAEGAVSALWPAGPRLGFLATTRIASAYLRQSSELVGQPGKATRAWSKVSAIGSAFDAGAPKFLVVTLWPFGPSESHDKSARALHVTALLPSPLETPWRPALQTFGQGRAYLDKTDD